MSQNEKGYLYYMDIDNWCPRNTLIAHPPHFQAGQPQKERSLFVDCSAPLTNIVHQSFCPNYGSQRARNKSFSIQKVQYDALHNELIRYAISVISILHLNSELKPLH